MNTIVPYWEDKVWGRVMHCFSSFLASISYLEVMERTRCSIHKHAERANQFIVLSGILVVETFADGEFGKPFERKIIAEGDIYTIPSQVYHRFQVLETGKVIEVYWPDSGGTCRMDDIERIDEGGSM